MSLHSVLFLLAASLSVMGALAHELAGAPKVLAPLAQTSLPADVIWLHHFSWHVGTVAVLVMATMFVMAVFHPAGLVFAILATVMSAGFAALGIALATFGNPALWQTPAPYPWLIIALLGSIGLWLGRASL